MPPRRRVCRVLDAPPAQTLWRRRACARIPPLESVSRASSTHTEQMDEVTAADAEAGRGRRRPSRKRAANLPTSPPTRPALLYLNKLFARESRDWSHWRSCRRCRHCAGPARLGRDRAVARRMSCCLCRFNLTATVLKNEHEFLAWAMARACACRITDRIVWLPHVDVRASERRGDLGRQHTFGRRPNNTRLLSPRRPEPRDIIYPARPALSASARHASCHTGGSSGEHGEWCDPGASRG